MSRVVSVLCAAALLVSGCGSEDSAGPPRYDSSAARIETTVGESFLVALDANTSTGYEWVLPRGEGRTVRLTSSEYEADPGSEDRDGGGGTQTLAFEAVRAGTEEIRLDYVFTGGAGRGDASARHSFEVTVDAR